MTFSAPLHYCSLLPVYLGVMGDEPGVSQNNGCEGGIQYVKRKGLDVVAWCDERDGSGGECYVG